MAYTSIEVVNILYCTIKNSVLMTDVKKPNGSLKKYERPLNSVSEDVVINGLPINRDDVQECVLNVNIYVPNLQFTKDSPGYLIADKAQPDTARLEYLARLANVALGDGEEIWDEEGNYCFKIQQDTIIADQNNQNYVNMRVEFYASNN